MPDVTTPVRVRLQRSAAARAGRRRGGPVSEFNVEQRDVIFASRDHGPSLCSPMPTAPRVARGRRRPSASLCNHHRVARLFLLALRAQQLGELALLCDERRRERRAPLRGLLLRLACLRLFITAVSSVSSSEVAVAMLCRASSVGSDSLTRDTRGYARDAEAKSCEKNRKVYSYLIWHANGSRVHRWWW
jgi:hypothetical protein